VIRNAHGTLIIACELIIKQIIRIHLPPKSS